MKSISELERDFNDKNLSSINFDGFDKLKALVDGTPRNRQKMYDHNIYFHKLNCSTWMNARSGHDLTKQIDVNFDKNKLI